MATTHSHSHGVEALASEDPTKSKTLRRRYSQRLRGGFGRVSAAARTGIVERDIFGLTDDGESLVRPPSQGNFPRRRDQQIQTFIDWLRRAFKREVLSIISPDGNEFVQAAYGKGLRHAGTALRKQDIDVPSGSVQTAFNLPVHKDALQLLYTSDYSDLEGITAEVSKQANRVLVEGFTRGHHPRKIARGLTDRIDKIGKTRAEVLARTSVIDAHNTASLNRYDRAGVRDITVEVEFSDSDDSRVCPICRKLDGSVYTIQEAREGTFDYAGSDYPIKPPVHARCRCALLPIVDGA